MVQRNQSLGKWNEGGDIQYGLDAGGDQEPAEFMGVDPARRNQVPADAGP